MTYDAEGRRHESNSCTTTTTDSDNQKCVAAGGSVGAYNGTMTCIASNKGPKLTETTKQVDKTTDEKADGGKKETTTTTTTTKTCVGAGACSTSTTTVVTTSNTNADGTAGSSSSQCKGSNCTTNGQAGNGSGSGSGSGSDDQGEEEEEDEEIASPTKALGKGEQGDFTEGVTEWDEKLQGARDELDDKLEEYSALFAGVFDLNLGSGGGSLPCEQIPVTIGTATVSLDMCLDRYADTLSYLRYALLLAASAFAALIVMG
ncbi:hypothetical protein [Aquipseudomonas ullengensis]|uniref:Uncharacterized protein n=1 Tax=Aquipseudomonas ullengensis TaxID=2759166 RepID=A0A7W4LJT8_9GAMM|nr:hypothetical protein [Pseudomonas ullengensis]MBB2494487.1 hypothetical protein [Pseudomonas ullengensis]